MFIELGVFNFKMLIPLIYTISYIPRKKFFQSYSPLYENFINYISFLLAGVIYLILLFRARRINKAKFSFGADKGTAIYQIEQQLNEKEKKQKKKEKISLFLLTLLHFLPFWADFILKKKITDSLEINHSAEIVAVSIFYFYLLFSKLLLNEKIYKHHVISIIIISICLGILLICYKPYFNIYIADFIIALILTFLIQGLKALFSVLVKNHFNYYLTDPDLFMFYLGLFGILTLTPFEIIYFFCSDENSEKGTISQIISNSGGFFKNFLYFILQILSSVFLFGSVIFTIYHFTPCHLTTPIMILAMIYIIVGWENEEIGYKIFFIFLNVIMIIFSLIYNEVIIIKLCSLEKYTSKYISIRQKTEYDSLDKNFNDDEDEKDYNL